MPSPSRPLPAASDIKLIVTDVDGTLLDSHHDLPPSSPTYQVLRRIRAAHPALPIVLSTGKPYSSTAPLRDALDLHAFPCCHLNGGVVYAPGGGVLRESALAPGVVGEVWRLLAARRVGLFMYTREQVFQVRDVEDGQWARMIRLYGTEIEDCLEEGRAAELLRRVENGEIAVVKMEVCEDEAELPETRRLLESLPAGSFTMTSALTFTCELIPPDNDKGTALAFLLDNLSISPANAIAFGDGDNDVSMFRVAGMSVAMENAFPQAKEAAVWQAETNDTGGVGRFLESIFFP